MTGQDGLGQEKVIQKAHCAASEAAELLPWAFGLHEAG